MTLSQYFCKNFCKILQQNALLLTNSCKICLYLEIYLQQLYSILTVDSAIAKYVQKVYRSSNFTSNGWLWMLFGEMHKLSERNVLTDNLFLARSCKIFTKNAFLSRNTTLAKLLQEMRKRCKNFARCIFLQQFCKSCIDCKNFGRFLQKLFFLRTREINDLQ